GGGIVGLVALAHLVLVVGDDLQRVAAGRQLAQVEVLDGGVVAGVQGRVGAPGGDDVAVEQQLGVEGVCDRADALVGHRPVDVQRVVAGEGAGAGGAAGLGGEHDRPAPAARLVGRQVGLGRGRDVE